MSGGGIRFRPYTETDLDAVRALQARSFAELAGHHHTPEQIAAHVALIEDAEYGAELARNNLIVACEASGAIVGSAGWCAQEGEPGTARIRKVFVAPRTAGTGLGRRLVERAEEDAQARGFERFFVRANANAEGFYARLGYAAVERGVMPAGGADLPVVFMRKA